MATETVQTKLNLDASQFTSMLDKILNKVNELSSKLNDKFNIDSSGADKLSSGLDDAGKNAKGFNEELKKTEKTLNEVSGSSTKFIEAFAIGEIISGLGESLTKFSQGGIKVRDELLNLQAKSGATAEELKGLEQSAYNLFKAGVGGGVDEAVKAISTARQQLGGLFNAKELEEFTKGAAALGQVFDKDVNEVINNSKSFIQNFGVSATEAFELLSLGLQGSGSAQDDFLDTLNEYSPLMKRAGYSAAEFVGILNNGMASGAYNTDKLADAIKETNIRIMEGDIAKELGDISEVFGKDLPATVSKTLNGIVSAAKAGQLSTADLLKQSADVIKTGFDEGQISEVLRDKLTRAISGTMAEDIGGEVWTNIFSADIDQASINQKAKQAGEQVQNALGPVTFAEKFTKEIELLSTQVSSQLGPIASQVGTALSGFGSFAPALSLLLDSPITKFKDLGNTVKGIVVPAFNAFKVSVLTNPITAVVAAIGLAIAGIALYSDYVSKTAQRDAEAAESNVKSIDIRIKAKQKEIDLEKQSLNSIANLEKLGEKYDELSSKTNLSAEETKKLNTTKKSLNDQLLQLNSKYPDSIDLTKSWSENMSKLKKDLNLGDVDYSKLTQETKSAITTFEQLGKKQKLTADESKKLEAANKTLTQTFPGAIKEGGSYADNLLNIQTAAGLSSDNLKKLQGEVTNLQAEMNRGLAQVSVTKIAVNKDEILKEFDSFWEGKKPVYAVIAPQIDDIAYAKTEDQLIKAQNIAIETLQRNVKDAAQRAPLEAKILEITKLRTEELKRQNGAENAATEEQQKKIDEINKKTEEQKKKDEDARKKAEEARKKIIDDLEKEFQKRKELLTQQQTAADLEEQLQLAKEGRTKNTEDELKSAKEILTTNEKIANALLDVYKKYLEVGTDGVSLQISKNTPKDIAESLGKILPGVNNEVKKAKINVINLETKLLVDKNALQSEIDSLDFKKIELQVQLGEIPQSTITSIINKNITDIENDIATIKYFIEIATNDNDTATALDLSKKLIEGQNKLFETQGKLRQSKLAEWNDIERQYYKDNSSIVEDSLEFQQGLLIAKRDFDLKINKDNTFEQKKTWTSFYQNLGELRTKYYKETEILTKGFFNNTLKALKSINFSAFGDILSSSLENSFKTFEEIPKLKEDIGKANEDLIKSEQAYKDKKVKLEKELADLYSLGGDASRESIEAKQKELEDLDSSWVETKDNISNTIDQLNAKLTDLTPWNAFKTGISQILGSITSDIKSQQETLFKSVEEQAKKVEEYTKTKASLEEDYNKSTGLAREVLGAKMAELNAGIEANTVSTTEVATQAWANFAVGTSAALFQLAADNKIVAGNIVGVLLDQLSAMIPIFVAWITGQELAKLSFAGIATAAALSLILKGAASAARAAASGAFAEGGEVNQGILKHGSGLVPTSTRFIEINETGEPEYIVNAKATKKYKGLLEMINQGKDPSGYFKNKLHQSNIYSTNLDLSEMVKQQSITNDRLLKIENAQLNSYNRSTVKIEQSPLKVQGTDLVSVVDKINRRRMS